MLLLHFQMLSIRGLYGNIAAQLAAMIISMLSKYMDFISRNFLENICELSAFEGGNC